MEQKDNNQNNNAFKGHSVTDAKINSFYQRLNSLSVISKKTEKIVTAIYMVTDFAPESEPLRFQLRTVALDVLVKVRQLGSRAGDGDYVLADDISRRFSDAETLINLGSTIGIISPMNGSILMSEIGKVVADIRRTCTGSPIRTVSVPGYAGVALDQSYFAVESTPIVQPIIAPVVDNPDTEARAVEEVHKGHIEHKVVLNDNKTENKTDKKDPSNRTTAVGIKIARRHDVLSIVKDRGQVSIKDVTSILKDMSEKTVQRELLALVKQGVLKKEGEKRWSVYRIAS